MRLLKKDCPTCGKSAKGTLERLSGLATIAIGADGSFDHDGQGTTIFWDESRTVENEAGEICLLCEDGHEWFSPVDPGSTEVRA